MLNDFGWFFQLYAWPPMFVWGLCFAIAVHRDPSTPSHFPKWVSWATILAMSGFLPVGFMGFVTKGPLSYDGFLSFWVAVGAYLTWNLIVDYFLWKAIADAEARIDARVLACTADSGLLVPY